MANTLNLGNGNWATKEDSLLAYNSENGNFKPLPFDFTRASSATVVNKDGLIETVGSGEPRIDFSNDAKGALKLEPSRSNAITNSEEFGSTGWSFVTTGSAIAPIVSDNYAISPDGTQNAQRIQFDLGGGTTTSDRTIIRQNVGAQSDWFLSVWMKSTNGTEQKILWHTTADSNETVVTGEWQRFTFSRNGVTNSWAGLCLRGSVSDVDTADILVYGFQVEQGSYATSYIPNFGNSAGATRSADVCNNGGNEQVINSTEGVLYYEGSALTEEVVDKRIFLSDGTMNNYVAIGYSRFAGNIISEMVSGGVLQTVNWGATGVNKTNNNKFAFSWGGGTMKFYVNGTQTNTESVTSPTGLNVLEFNTADDIMIMYSNTKDLRVYNTALTNAELKALTI